MLFIFLLGHDIDFGHMEAVNLLSSNKYSEKQIVSYISRTIKHILIGTCYIADPIKNIDFDKGPILLHPS